MDQKTKEENKSQIRQIAMIWTSFYALVTVKK